MSWFEKRIPPPLVAALFAAAMWLIARWLPELAFQFPGRKIVGVAAVAAGVVPVAAGVEKFIGARTTVNPLRPETASSLVTGGVFGLTRNPMYLGLALALFGWVLWLGNGACALLLAGFVGYITRFQIIPEERALRAHFGEPFEAYTRRVRRWL
jgi:protein-S-isoprenylcysteine O-methyltransferase Ste14